MRVQAVEPYLGLRWSSYYQPIQKVQPVSDPTAWTRTQLGALERLEEARTPEESAVLSYQEVEDNAAQPVSAQAAAQETAQPQTSRQLSGVLVEFGERMNAAGVAQKSSMTASYSLADLYRFHNQYLYGTYTQTWAKIDADGDGVWSYGELSAYADAYQQATGRALDVDDLMARYSDTGDNTGVIRYADQNRMYQDDALGINYAKDALLLAEYNQGGGSGSQSINSKYLDEFVSKYTYGSGNKLYAAMDKNEDGVWTLDELTAYATAYEKATGVKLDVETLMAKYDKEGKGYLNYYDQNNMYNDDALGLSRISQALADRKNAGSDGKESGSGTEGNLSLADRIKEALGSMSSSSLGALANSFAQGIQKAALLDAFMMTNMAMRGRGSRYGMYGGGIYSMGLYASWNTMGMLYLLR